MAKITRLACDGCKVVLEEGVRIAGAFVRIEKGAEAFALQPQTSRAEVRTDTDEGTTRDLCLKCFEEESHLPLRANKDPRDSTDYQQLAEVRLKQMEKMAADFNGVCKERDAARASLKAAETVRDAAQRERDSARSARDAAMNRANQAEEEASRLRRQSSSSSSGSSSSDYDYDRSSYSKPGGGPSGPQSPPEMPRFVRVTTGLCRVPR